MPYEETGKEKVKREAYYKANKERGIRAEKQQEYERFGTTEQNIPQANPMGDVVAPAAAGMKKGGKVRGHGCETRGKTKGTMITMCGGGYAKGKK
jgi:hypothetical protein